MRRRDLLAGTALGVAILSLSAQARVITGVLPWEPDTAIPPDPAMPGPWKFFTAEEGAAVEALVDRIIPPDPQHPGGKDAGCAVFIDRQLAGPYGSARGLYMRPPFRDGTKQQGDQSPLTPAQRYRQSLAALDKHCKSAAIANRLRRSTSIARAPTPANLSPSSVQSSKTSLSAKWRRARCSSKA